MDMPNLHILDFIEELHGKPSSAEYEAITDRAARDLMRARPGLSYGQARAMLAGDLAAIRAKNDAEADAHNAVMLWTGWGLGIGALLILFGLGGRR